jgi:hypothetical protein
LFFVFELGLEILNPLAPASQVGGIIGMYHHT